MNHHRTLIARNAMLLLAGAAAAQSATPPTDADRAKQLADPLVDATERGLVRLERAHLIEMLDLNPGRVIELCEETVADMRAARVVRAYAYFRGAEWMRMAGDRNLDSLVSPDAFEATADLSFGPERRTRRLAEYDPELVEATIESLRALNTSPLREPPPAARPFVRSRDYATQIGERLDQSGGAVERDRLRDAWQEARAKGSTERAREIRRQLIRLRNATNGSRDMRRFALTVLRYRLDERDDIADRFERAMGTRDSRQGRLMNQRVQNAVADSLQTAELYASVQKRLLKLVESTSGSEQANLTRLESNLQSRVRSAASKTDGQADALRFLLRLPYYRVELLTGRLRRN